MGLNKNLHSRLLQKKKIVFLHLQSPWRFLPVEERENTISAADLPICSHSHLDLKAVLVPLRATILALPEGMKHGTIPINNTQRASHRPQASPHHPLWCLTVVSPPASSVFPAWSRLSRSVGNLRALFPLNGRILSADPT